MTSLIYDKDVQVFLVTTAILFIAYCFAEWLKSKKGISGKKAWGVVMVWAGTIFSVITLPAVIVSPSPESIGSFFPFVIIFGIGLWLKKEKKV